MLEFPAKLWFLIHRLEEAGDGRAQVWVEPLLFPEITSFGESATVLRQRQADLAGEVLAAEPLSRFHQRFLPVDPELAEITVEVSPLKSGEAWSDPVTLKICYAWWRHGAVTPLSGAGGWVAWVPALRIGLVAATEAGMAERVRLDVLSAVRREEHHSSLDRLARIARGRTELHAMSWNAWPGSPSERWLKEQAATGKSDPLKELTVLMEPDNCPPGYELGPLLGRVARLLGADDRPSVLLVGAAGTGKTALVQELVRQRSHLGLSQYSIHRTSGAVLVAGACGFGMWQQRCQDLIGAARKSGVILYAGNLFELANTGQSAASTENIASFFRPALVQGGLQMIVECTPEQFSVLEKQDPRLTESLRIVRVTEPDPETGLRILQAAASRMGGAGASRFAPEALQQVALLHRRYAALSAFPGRPLRFMNRLSEGSPAGKTVGRAEVFAAFSDESGMPQTLLDPALPLDPQSVTAWFSTRIRGQQGAVEAVVEMLCRTKAALSRPGRPLASFLFAGPTGTGKTETAKALAQWLFRSPDRLVRIDASEYTRPWSAGRLVSGSRDGKEGILTAAVRGQPFGVVLIDEFEKAHPAVFDLLLQVLGEARLTDAAGRVADFSNCVIILTSNLGAENFGRKALGFGRESRPDGGAHDHFSEAVRRAVRPEFFNRIDRIVAFQPLPREIVRQLALREVALAAARPGLAGAGLVLEVPDELVDRMAEEGWDARYGARPLKRKVSERLLAPLAEVLCRGVPPRSVISAVPHGEDVRIQVKPPAPHGGEAMEQSLILDRLAHAGRMRRRWTWLAGQSFSRGLASRHRLLGEQIASARRMKKSARELAVLTKEHQRKGEILTQLQEQMEAQAAAEESLLLRHCGGALEGGAPGLPVSGNGVWEKLFLTLLAEARQVESVALILHSGHGAALMEAARIYRELAIACEAAVEAVFYRRKPGPDRIVRSGDLPDQVRPEPPGTPSEQQQMMVGDGAGLGAVVLWITGRLASLFLQGESGIHVAGEALAETGPKQKGGRAGIRESCRISLTVRPAEDYLRREDLLLGAEELLRPELSGSPARRVYDLTRKVVRDGITHDKRPGSWSAAWLLEELRRSVMLDAGWSPGVERSLE